MLRLLLNPQVVLYALIALAIATPLATYFARNQIEPRTRLIIACAGPFALLFWFFHNAVMNSVGFDRIASVLIVCGSAIAIGFAAGWWASQPPTTR